MSAKRVRRRRSDWQPERSPSQKSQKPDSLTAHQNAPIEVANVAPGAMMDNVMRSRNDSKGVSQKPNPEAATPPQAIVQPKLAIGEPNDKYEQQADRMATEVVQKIHAPVENNDNTLQRQTKISFPVVSDRLPEKETLQSKTEAYRQIWGDVLQAKRDNSREAPHPNFETDLNRARSTGETLEPKLQNRMGRGIWGRF